MLRAAAGNREPVVFNPANLFASGEFGGFYDFSDTSTLFTDQARTTPVTTTGNAVRGVTDLSGNNNHLINSLGTPTWNSAGLFSLYHQNSEFQFLKLLVILHLLLRL